jgi:hypothetical protein
MSVISMKQLLEAGVHFGHQTRRWNPKMKKYIFTERNGIYIIDLQKTVKKVEEAYNWVKDLAANGGTVLFVGTVVVGAVVVGVVVVGEVIVGAVVVDVVVVWIVVVGDVVFGVVVGSSRRMISVS